MEFLNLGLGVPCQSLLPLAGLCHELERLAAEGRRDSLGYGPIRGDEELRALLAGEPDGYYRGLRPADFLITHGATDAISLVARAFLSPGDVVFVETPTYKFALTDLAAQGATIVQVACDQDGLRPEALAQAITEVGPGRRPRLLYTMPTFQNPTGATLPLLRRQRILDTARAAGLVVLEDDAYFQLRYRGQPLPPLVTLDRERDGIVLHAGTFSKTIAPGIRLGWLCTRNADLMDRVLALKPPISANPLLAAVVLRYVRGGEFQRALERARAHYAHNASLAAAALAPAAELGIELREPDGGFYFWLRLPPSWSATSFVARCARLGVGLMNGGDFFGGPPGGPAVRIAISTTSPQEIQAAARVVLAAARTFSEERAA
jgi:2-aminoadipate transaminase